MVSFERERAILELGLVFFDYLWLLCWLLSICGVGGAILLRLGVLVVLLLVFRVLRLVGEGRLSRLSEWLVSGRGAAFVIRLHPRTTCGELLSITISLYLLICRTLCIKLLN